MVVYGNESCYYKIDSEAFSNFEMLILPVSYAEPFDEVYTAAVVTEYKKGKIEAQVKVVDRNEVNRWNSLLIVDEVANIPSVNEVPKVKEYILIALQTSNDLVYHYIYEEDGADSMEIPYEGIWKISAEAVEEIRAILEDADGTVNAEEVQGSETSE